MQSLIFIEWIFICKIRSSWPVPERLALAIRLVLG
jgi:hypothetical protein